MGFPGRTENGAGGGLRDVVAMCARTLPAQQVEARIGCKVLNQMTALSMPVSRKVA